MKAVHYFTIVILTVLLTGCASKAGDGAAVGTPLGAALGGYVASRAHVPVAAGAAGGAVLGGGAGYVIGNEMDKSDLKKGQAETDKQQAFQAGQLQAIESRPTPAPQVAVVPAPAASPPMYIVPHGYAVPDGLTDCHAVRQQVMTDGWGQMIRGTLCRRISDGTSVFIGTASY